MSRDAPLMAQGCQSAGLLSCRWQRGIARLAGDGCEPGAPHMPDLWPHMPGLCMVLIVPGARGRGEHASQRLTAPRISRARTCRAGSVDLSVIRRE